MADIIEAIVEILKADASVSALVATRVFGGELPEAEAGSMPRNAIVVQPAGGTSMAAGTFSDHDSQRLDIFHYGVTPFEANTLRRTSRKVLTAVRRKVIAGVLVHWAEPAGGFSAGRDPDGDWPVAHQSYQAFFAEEQI